MLLANQMEIEVKWRLKFCVEFESRQQIEKMKSMKIIPTLLKFRWIIDITLEDSNFHSPETHVVFHHNPSEE